MSVKRRFAIGAAVATAIGGGFVANQLVTGGATEAGADSATAIIQIDAGVAYLKQTTISYPNWLSRNYAPGVRATTAWGRALASFEAAKVALTPPPPPPPPVTTTAPTTTAAPDTQPPSVPGNGSVGLFVSNITQTSVRMTWVASLDNVGIDHYNLYKNGVKVSETAALLYDYMGLNCGTQYAIGVEAVDTSGNVSILEQAIAKPTTLACTTTTTTATTAPPPVTTAPPPTTTAPPSSGTANIWVARP